MMDFYSRVNQKPVMSSSGEIIGYVKGFLADEKWNLTTMVTKPSNGRGRLNIPTDDDGNYLIPMANVNVGNDAIVVMNIESIRRLPKQDQQSGLQ
ncbi:PRC-barrel domain-containing protein [Thermoplasma sp.]|uniref:PRC-barrel domain-containing protein n=1 Tax=Thermoplasma sp. TaxID=1973142 RepID=UPI0012878873|nr:PRC-barrel domain-containing protein [Thermoplasma sp.]KAA8923100.1 MAG: PRC-barrel domain containing protein [Thermoplasma sp.]